MRNLTIVLISALLAACGSRGSSGLAAYIRDLKAIDTHAHPLAYVAPGAPADTDYDALPLDGIPDFPLPWGLRPENPVFRTAQRMLYGLKGNDTGAAWTHLVDSARAAIMKREGANFPDWALDQANDTIMLANRIAMDGLDPARFKWVVFDDALMYPLDISGEAARSPDFKALYPLEAKQLQRDLAALGMHQLPATFDAYVRDVVDSTLAMQRAEGAVSIKFEAAYLRPLDFGPADTAPSRAIYARYVNGGVPTHTEYLTLENTLFRIIARESGRLGMAIQIHVLDQFGGYYDPNGATPAELESVFDDPALRQTKFVIVHGGWPHVDETLAMLAKPNVYTDISMMDLIGEPGALVHTLRMWLNEWPEKVMFGSDAFDGGNQQGWDQLAWLGSRNARWVLTGALTGMVQDGEITEARATELAKMVLYGNAVKVYGSGGTSHEP
jgi:uncharacterized protein